MWERIQPRSRDVVELQGHTWGLPVEAGTYVLFYNKNHFAEAGIPEPKRGWTWDDLLDRARKHDLVWKHRVMPTALKELAPKAQQILTTLGAPPKVNN